MNPQSAEIHVHLGTCLLVLQKYGEADRSFAHALALNPDLAEAQFKAGVASLHLWNCEGAVRHLKRACALKPDSVDVMLQLAVALKRNQAASLPYTRRFRCSLPTRSPEMPCWPSSAVRN